MDPGTPRDGEQASISAEHLCVRRGGGPALTEVDLRLQGGIVAIVGPNGAGKSTLLRTLATLTPRFEGEIAVAGHDIRRRRGIQAARRALGFLPQDPSFLGHLRVSEAVEYAAWLHGIRRARRVDSVLRGLEQLNLAELAPRHLGTLSGGTRRRVYIAQAVVHEPSVLLLDEPTVGLDAEQRVNLRRVIRGLSSHRLIVLSSHLTEDIELLPDRVVVLGSGRVRFNGPPSELKRLGAEAGHTGEERPIERGLRLVSGWE